MRVLYTGYIDTFKSTVNATYTSMTSTNLTNVYTTSCPSIEAEDHVPIGPGARIEKAWWRIRGEAGRSGRQAHC